MSVVTRQRALREGHPILTAGAPAWYVPRLGREYGTRAVPVRLVGAGRVRGPLSAREVSVLLPADAPTVDGDRVNDDGLPHAGQVLSVPDLEVGPDALRDHSTTPTQPGERYRIPPQWALDLFCPVHGYIHDYIHRAPISLCVGEPQPRPPLAGDAVRLAAPCRWAGSMVTVGELGVMGGIVGTPITTGTPITFNARTFRNDHVVSCSGGPGTIETPVDELTRTDDTVSITAWEWRDGFARARNDLDYQITVPIWDWHPID